MIKNKKFDRIVIISDNQSWIDDAQYNKNQYMHMAPETSIFCIDIQGYGTKDITGTNTHYITGWSDNVLKYIKYAEMGSSLVDKIKHYENTNNGVSAK